MNPLLTPHEPAGKSNSSDTNGLADILRGQMFG
jgi:hypothetical protein